MIVEIFSEFNPPSTTWIGINSTDWFDANNWSNGIPNTIKRVTIAPATNGCIMNSSGSAYNITVLNGASLTINSELVISNSFTNFGTSASVLIGTTGTLTQTTSNVTNTGSISLRRSSTIVLNDYTYWCGPLNGSQTLQGFSPNSNLKYFLAYDNGWIYANATKTTWGGITGYAIIAPKSISYTEPSVNTFEFVGNPNNLNSYSVNALFPTGGTSNSFVKLLGNPYPTRINLDKFIMTNIDKVTYISVWTHYHGPTGTTFDSSAYSNYTLFGGLSTDDANVTRQTKWVDAGVGFVVSGIKEGLVTVYHDMKFDDNFNIPKHRVWLNFTNVNTKTEFSQNLFGYSQVNSNLFHMGYDISGNTLDFQIYTVKSGLTYPIQVMPLPFQNTDIFNLGYATTLSGTHRISYSSSDGVFSGSQAVYLNDTILSAKTNLKLSGYSFNTSAGTFNNRFKITFI